MKATINGITVEGTPAELLEFYRITRDQRQDPNKTLAPSMKESMDNWQRALEAGKRSALERHGYTWNGPVETSYVTKALQNEVT